MKTLYALLFALGCFINLSAQNQYLYEDARWYVGTGMDTAYIIIDFQSAQTYDPPSSFVYGYLFDGMVTGETALQDLDAADDNLYVGFSGGFVDSIALGSYNGQNGTGGNYWGIYSDTLGAARWVSNAGSAEILLPGAYYGLSYNDFAPEILPDTAVAVNNPDAFKMADILNFVGTGSDTAVFVVDFLNGNSFAWGYLFNGTATGEEMMTAIAAADDSLTIDIAGGFLNDIAYLDQVANAGMPNYWNTWNANNNGIWYTNTGVSEVVNPGDWYGCSYPSFPPAIYPGTPAAALKDHTTGIFNTSSFQTLSFYPNPATEIIHIENVDEIDITAIQLINSLGQSISLDLNADITIPAQLAAGQYVLLLTTPAGRYSAKIAIL